MPERRGELKSDDHKGNRRNKTDQGSVLKIITHEFDDTVAWGKAAVVYGKNSRTDYQRINRVGPVIGGPSID